MHLTYSLISVGEDNYGNLKFYSMASAINGTDVFLLFDPANNLVANSDGILIDAQKEISTYMQDGKYYLLTQKGNSIYKHQVDITQFGLGCV